MRLLLACLCLLLPIAAACAETDEAALWAALRGGGHVALSGADSAGAAAAARGDRAAILAAAGP